ncbi:microtubule-associated protein futsch-like isoform X2 [Palaemon carinicauda]|uniref:microtubule-associated protein futsch-like isoform X2 n=1 Tax=Palaemon carinicauda TaxID=392227 RepID=UPI0035B60D76
MDIKVFTEQDLQGKKYGELLKLAKSIGANHTSDTGRRLKTVLLIEAILEAQAASTLAEDATTVISALNESVSSKDLFAEEEPIAPEELISDIQFPEDLEDEVPSAVQEKKPQEECFDSEPPNTEPKTTRKRKGTFDVEESSENVSPNGRKSGKHRRTGTYEVTEEDKVEDPIPAAKRRRTSTFEVNPSDGSNDSASKSVSKDKVRTDTYEVTEEDKMEDLTPAGKRRKTAPLEANSTGESNDDSSKEASDDKVQENSHQLEALRIDISNDKRVSAGSPSLSENGSVGKLNLRSRSIVINRKRESAVPKHVEEVKLTSVLTSGSPKSSSTGMRQSLKPRDPSSVQKLKILKATRTPTRPNSRKSELVSENLNKRTPNLSRKSGVAAEKVALSTPSSSRKSGLASGMLAAGMPSNFRKSLLASGKLPNGTPKSNGKLLNATPKTDVKHPNGTPKTEGKPQESSKIMKPLFSVGHGNPPAKEGKESKLPRFVTYARKLKVPNFAKIHEKAFKRMEALDDYVDKKKKIFDNQGSATKKPRPTRASGEIFKPSVTNVENLNLNFAGKTPAGKSPKFKPGANKSPKSCQKNIRETKSAKKSPKIKTQASLLKTPKAIAKKSPGTSTQSKKVASSVRKSSSALKESSKSHHSNIPKPHKENLKPGFVSFVSPAPVKVTGVTQPAITPGKESNLKSHIKKPSYVPYKGALKPVNTAEVYKTMSAKIPPVKTIKDRREDQKRILVGVRFNKRFELQMAKRGIDITQ